MERERLREGPRPEAPEVVTSPAVARLPAATLALADAGTRARTLTALQRGAGNAVIARALSPAQAENIADEVHDGVEGLGTDEDQIYAAMRPVTAADLPQLSTTYRARHKADLVGDLRDDLSDDEIQQNIPALRRSGPDAVAFELQGAIEGAGTDEGRIYRALSGVTAGELPGIEAAYRARTGKDLRAELEDELTTAEFRRLTVYQAVGLDGVAQQIHDAIEGAGTDENAVFAALSGRSVAEINIIAHAYERMYGNPMVDDLRDDLSDAELERLDEIAPIFAPAADEASSAAAIAGQLHEAMDGLGTNEEAVFAALSLRTEDEIAAISAAYRSLTGNDLEADLRDELSGDDLQRALTQIGIAPTISEEDTELGGLVFGNFDFEYSGGKVTITVRLRFAFREDVPEPERDPFKQRFLAAARATWQDPPFMLQADGWTPYPDVPIKILALESDSDAHKVVDVTNDERREHVIDEVNVSKLTTDTTIAHEFGHVLGLCDEYDGGLENLMFWHENRADDPSGIMNMGTGHRARYFENIRQRVQAAAPPGCVYHVVRTR